MSRSLVDALLGQPGRVLFYAGIFSAVYTSIIGHAAGLGRLGTHAWLRWQAGSGPISSDFRHHACFRWIARNAGAVPASSANWTPARGRQEHRAAEKQLAAEGF